ncbi:MULTISPECIES: redoxin family protein [unclassified Pseudoalteromonas]|uniref:TlpA family protein disulfide reductase n=1 Tax=unclassified Pseudoalteromonas TaxID=194690 RepID=UPI0025B5D07B|nr:MULTISPECIES: redoxin family protein [unclassified Pseudoalteromonas]MDN3379854.1 redoxin family protein [Pseudoalteromonas sp. APC 3893]MDN3388194.1 redoxin family protein [Pseudoalteromonas sp. APC 4017]
MNNKVISFMVVVILQLMSYQALASEQPLFLTTESGKLLNLSAYQPKQPMYLKFWATWCKPCMEQMPHFQNAYTKFGKKITFIAVNIDLNDDTAAIKKVKQRFNLSMAMMTDHTGKVAKYYEFIGTPFHVLLDKTGKVIFQGRKADTALDNTLKLLSHDGVVSQSKLIDKKDNPVTSPLLIPPKGNKAVLFTATWCDWYLADTRPEMAKNCISAQQQVNKLAKQGIDTEAVISQLWTDQAAGTEYKEKFNVVHPLTIDYGNDLFIDNEVNTVPTLLIYKDGKIINRITDFSSPINMQVRH